MNEKTNVLKQTAAFTARNIKLFFKDKGMWISALIAPLIILMLYVLFLHNVLESSFVVGLPEGLTLGDRLIGGYVAAYEVSSILAVCCVTVAFIANSAMVGDRITGARADLTVSPVKGRVLVLGYYFATAVVTIAICFIAMLAGFCYIAAMGWSLSVADVFAIVLDVFLASLFGTALSSVVCYFLKSRGAISAVSTVVSSVYGFICGAYYPISQFSSGIANMVMCLPGTYCTSLLRSHFMLGYASEFSAAGLPDDAIDGILGAFDAKVTFFGTSVPTWAMYVVVTCSIVALVGIFVLLNTVKLRKKTVKCIRNEKNAIADD